MKATPPIEMAPTISPTLPRTSKIHRIIQPRSYLTAIPLTSINSVSRTKTESKELMAVHVVKLSAPRNRKNPTLKSLLVPVIEMEIRMMKNPTTKLREFRSKRRRRSKSNHLETTKPRLRKTKPKPRANPKFHLKPRKSRSFGPMTSLHPRCRSVS